jgi:hypothetical protein
MALIWLKYVPTILSNAPVIMEGARKLAAMMRNRSQAEADALPVVDENAPADWRALAARLNGLEERQQDGAELLRSLAENHAQLAQAVDALRTKAKISMRIAIASLLIAAGTLIWMLAR